MKKISIPVPCHEDWNKMTPQEKGRFCDACQKVVIDFTGKDSFAINDLLAEAKGSKVCGHILPSQMEQFNKDFEQYSFHSTRSFQSAFAFSLIVVFGLGLFSCTSQQQSLELNQWRKEVKKASDKIVHETEQQGDSNATLGYVSCDIVETETIEPTQWSEIVVNGGLEMESYPELPIQPIPNNEIIESPTRGDVSVEYLGGIKLVEREIIEEPFTLQQLKASVYPNPSNGVGNIVIELPKDANTSIAIYNMEGKLVFEREKELMNKGKNEVSFDISEQANGIYLIKIVTRKESKTIRLVKG